MAESIQVFRRREAITQQELAERITRWLAQHDHIQITERKGARIGYHTIQEWENGGRLDIKPWYRRGLAGVMGIPLAEVDNVLRASAAYAREARLNPAPGRPGRKPNPTPTGDRADTLNKA